jgi:hypothetical protein
MGATLEKLRNALTAITGGVTDVDAVQESYKASVHRYISLADLRDRFDSGEIKTSTSGELLPLLQPPASHNLIFASRDCISTGRNMFTKDPQHSSFGADVWHRNILTLCEMDVPKEECYKVILGLTLEQWQLFGTPSGSPSAH